MLFRSGGPGVKPALEKHVGVGQALVVASGTAKLWDSAERGIQCCQHQFFPARQPIQQSDGKGVALDRCQAGITTGGQQTINDPLGVVKGEMLKLTDQGAFNRKLTPVETNSGDTAPAVTFRCNFPRRRTTTDPHAIKDMFKGNAQTAEIVFSGTEKQDTAEVFMTELAGKVGSGQHRITNMRAGYPNGRQRGNGFHGYARSEEHTSELQSHV